MMYRSVKGLMVILAMLCLAWLPAHLPGRTLRVGISQNPPKLMLNEDGKPEGIYVDILQYIASQEDWELEYVGGQWEALLEGVQNGDIDLLPDLAYSSERGKLFSFHETPVLFSWSQIFSRKGLNLQTIMDLNGLTVAVLKESIQASSLANMISGFRIKTELIYAKSFDEAMALVREGKADAAASNSFYGRLNARKYGLEESAVVFEPSSLYYATAINQNLDVLQAIEKHLVKLKHTPNSVYYRSVRKWSLGERPNQLPEWFWYAIALVLIIFAGFMISWFVLKHQVRERTKELKLANLEMEKRVEERTEDLAKAMIQAQVADQLKSAFLATMSHELRTPLNSIIGFTGILLQELPGKLNDEQRKQLQIVQGSSRHLLSLINDVLDISKIEAGQLELKYSQIVVRDVLSKLKDTVEAQTRLKDIGLELDCTITEDTFVTDQRRFEQIILNLLSNAVKFTEGGGKVSIRCQEKEHKLQVSISDTGIGIPKNQLDRLFRPFQQLDSGLTRKYDGSGLGLSISKKLANLMGGDILVQSELGQGSTFTLELPQVREAP
ncbi:MAG: ATP-binding protein [Candidatus Cloacimonetes bacterium]|nr:ATP-binding protein [Candidatus Cloacimonadota bacterium]